MSSGNLETQIFNNDTSKDGMNAETFWKYVGRFALYLGIVILFVINLSAMSLSLQCSNSEGNKGLFGKLFSALFAFIF